MKHSDFVHLHNHSDYSLLDGASAIPAMVKKAAKFEMPALALTDHGSMFGAVEFYQEASRAGVKPLIGMEAYVTRGKRTDRTPKDTARNVRLNHPWLSSSMQYMVIEFMPTTTSGNVQRRYFSTSTTP